MEQTASGAKAAPPDIRALAEVGRGSEVATDPKHAPAYMAEAALASNERTERLLEVGLVLLLGLMLNREWFSLENIGFALLLFLIIRPVAVSVGLLGIRVPLRDRALLSWFGIRGIGSIYYLMYAVTHHVPEETARHLIAITLSIVAVSIIAHGISVTPLMKPQER
jgi:NhaP-type Na+/H+ or K+/H+ antiporter